jgi:micrococcal nuclease
VSVPVIVPLFHIRLRLTAPTFLALFALVSSNGTLHAECRGDDGGSSLVTEIRGGDTLILEDGRSVRVFGALLPRRGGHNETALQAREAAERQIAELTMGKVVQLQLDPVRRDRYGRVMAQVFVTKDEQRIWLQEKLIAEGLARVMSSKENRGCVSELLAAEKTARDNRQGHWATGLFSVKPAASEDLLAGLTQSFEIIEGRVDNVTEVRGRVYVNFGRNWRRDFTATIPADALKLFPGEAASLGKLKGQVVRVRGWVENVNGPSVTVTHPEQLELLVDSTVLH